MHASVEKISHSNGSKPDEPWENLAFPTYLQSEVDDFCQDWDEALQVWCACSPQMSCTAGAVFAHTAYAANLAVAGQSAS